MIRALWLRLRLGLAVARGRVAVGVAPLRPIPYPIAHDGGDTVFLDPTHKHAFTPESLERLVRAVGGFTDIRTRTVVPEWSFLISAVRAEGKGEA